MSTQAPVDLASIHAPRFGLGAVYERDGHSWLVVEAPSNGDEVCVPIPDGETAFGFGRTWFRNDEHRRFMIGND